MERYELIKVVGQGSYGKALLCKRKTDTKKCIIKQINISKLNSKERAATEQESTLLSRLQHPNIVSFWESFKTKDSLCIVMEYADSGDLDQFLKSRKGKILPETEVLRIFIQIALAIKHIHDRKILHRDLKSQNIFLTSGNLIKLGDFGVSRILRNTGELAATQIGTPYYMSPEIMDGKKYNSKTDIWSLGIILYEIMCLKLPFDGNSMRQLCNNIMHANPIRPPAIYSLELSNFVTKELLAKSSKQRPSINLILAKEFLYEKVTSFLHQAGHIHEMNHTILHGMHVLRDNTHDPLLYPVPPPPPPVPSSAPMLSAGIGSNKPVVAIVHKPLLQGGGILPPTPPIIPSSNYAVPPRAEKRVPIAAAAAYNKIASKPAIPSVQANPARAVKVNGKIVMKHQLQGGLTPAAGSNNIKPVVPSSAAAVGGVRPAVPSSVVGRVQAPIVPSKKPIAVKSSPNIEDKNKVNEKIIAPVPDNKSQKKSNPIIVDKSKVTPISTPSQIVPTEKPKVPSAVLSSAVNNNKNDIEKNKKLLQLPSESKPPTSILKEVNTPTHKPTDKDNVFNFINNLKKEEKKNEGTNVTKGIPTDVLDIWQKWKQDADKIKVKVTAASPQQPVTVVNNISHIQGQGQVSHDKDIVKSVEISYKEEVNTVYPKAVYVPTSSKIVSSSSAAAAAPSAVAAVVVVNNTESKSIQKTDQMRKQDLQQTQREKLALMENAVNTLLIEAKATMEIHIKEAILNDQKLVKTKKSSRISEISLKDKESGKRLSTSSNKSDDKTSVNQKPSSGNKSSSHGNKNQPIKSNSDSKKPVWIGIMDDSTPTSPRNSSSSKDESVKLKGSNLNIKKVSPRDGVTKKPSNTNTDSSSMRDKSSKDMIENTNSLDLMISGKSMNTTKKQTATSSQMNKVVSINNNTDSTTSNTDSNPFSIPINNNNNDSITLKPPVPRQQQPPQQQRRQQQKSQQVIKYKLALQNSHWFQDLSKQMSMIKQQVKVVREEIQQSNNNNNNNNKKNEQIDSHNKKDSALSSNILLDPTLIVDTNITNKTENEEENDVIFTSTSIEIPTTDELLDDILDQLDMNSVNTPTSMFISDGGDINESTLELDNDDDDDDNDEDESDHEKEGVEIEKSEDIQKIDVFESQNDNSKVTDTLNDVIRNSHILKRATPSNHIIRSHTTSNNNSNNNTNITSSSSNANAISKVKIIESKGHIFKDMNQEKWFSNLSSQMNILKKQINILQSNNEFHTHSSPIPTTNATTTTDNDNNSSISNNMKVKSVEKGKVVSSQQIKKKPIQQSSSPRIGISNNIEDSKNLNITPKKLSASLNSTMESPFQEMDTTTEAEPIEDESANNGVSDELVDSNTIVVVEELKEDESMNSPLTLLKQHQQSQSHSLQRTPITAKDRIKEKRQGFQQFLQQQRLAHGVVVVSAEMSGNTRKSSIKVDSNSGNNSSPKMNQVAVSSPDSSNKPQLDLLKSKKSPVTSNATASSVTKSKSTPSSARGSSITESVPLSQQKSPPYNKKGNNISTVSPRIINTEISTPSKIMTPTEVKAKRDQERLEMMKIIEERRLAMKQQGQHGNVSNSSRNPLHLQQHKMALSPSISEEENCEEDISINIYAPPRPANIDKLYQQPLPTTTTAIQSTTKVSPRTTISSNASHPVQMTFDTNNNNQQQQQSYDYLNTTNTQLFPPPPPTSHLNPPTATPITSTKTTTTTKSAEGVAVHESTMSAKEENIPEGYHNLASYEYTILFEQLQNIIQLPSQIHQQQQQQQSHHPHPHTRRESHTIDHDNTNKEETASSSKDNSSSSSSSHKGLNHKISPRLSYLSPRISYSIQEGEENNSGNNDVHRDDYIYQEGDDEDEYESNMYADNNLIDSYPYHPEYDKDDDDDSSTDEDAFDDGLDDSINSDNNEDNEEDDLGSEYRKDLTGLDPTSLDDFQDFAITDEGEDGVENIQGNTDNFYSIDENDSSHIGMDKSFVTCDDGDDQYYERGPLISVSGTASSSTSMQDLMDYVESTDDPLLNIHESYHTLLRRSADMSSTPTAIDTTPKNTEKNSHSEDSVALPIYQTPHVIANIHHIELLRQHSNLSTYQQQQQQQDSHLYPATPDTQNSSKISTNSSSIYNSITPSRRKKIHSISNAFYNSNHYHQQIPSSSGPSQKLMQQIHVAENTPMSAGVDKVNEKNDSHNSDQILYTESTAITYNSIEDDIITQELTKETLETKLIQQLGEVNFRQAITYLRTVTQEGDDEYEGNHKNISSSYSNNIERDITIKNSNSTNTTTTTSSTTNNNSNNVATTTSTSNALIDEDQILLHIEKIIGIHGLQYLDDMLVYLMYD